MSEIRKKKLWIILMKEPTVKINDKQMYDTEIYEAGFDEKSIRDSCETYSRRDYSHDYAVDSVYVEIPDKFCEETEN